MQSSIHGANRTDAIMAPRSQLLARLCVLLRYRVEDAFEKLQHL